MQTPVEPAGYHYKLKANRYSHLNNDHMPSSIPLPPEAEAYICTLVAIASALGIDDLSFESYASAISRISADDLQARRSIIRMKHVKQTLATHLAVAKHEEYLIRKWADILQTDSEETLTEIEREKAAIATKSKEYQAELDVIEFPQEPSVTVSELASFRELFRKKEKELKAKRAKIQAFQGLPPNIELARHELREAQNEQMKLMQLRDRLLGRMAESVA